MSAGRIKGIFRWVFFLWLLIHLAKASECFCSLGDSSTPAQSRPNAASEIVGFMKSKTCFNGISQPGMEWIKVDKTEIFIRKHSLTACPDGLAQITSGIHHTRNGFETLKTQKTTNSRLRREERRFLLDSVNHAQCDFEVQSFCSWRNIQGGQDDFDWVLYQSSTPTDDTGPKFDHTLNNATGSYIFIESSAPRNTLDTAWIQSPEINATVEPVHCFRFWYHMFGSSIGSLNIYQVTHGILPGNLVWSLTGAQGSTWMEGQVPLSSNHSYSMLISGIVGDGYQGDIAIDDVSVSPGYCDVKPSIASRTNVTNTAIQCTLCKVNPQLCFVLTKVEMCPDSYCINEVTNKEDGSKWVDRRCGTYDECENDWWHSTSDDPDCQDYKPDQNTMKDIHCTYCCTTDNCNRDIKPAQDTLYTHPKK
ncbi:MAM and LDL-receptor class A domain-containing protein 1-like [Dreissena polymorpha]|uniref:MAM and LDL-receptor class A domain-containing protein 1-like n=1 Tax=Dreissena polymorpha TaxID=45954 RepID=UPI00226426EB|nr:MAM and LDL-receptor class A domain-containing protein 1-like [Dreissena polymorpha]